MWLMWLAILCITAFVVWDALIIRAQLDDAYAIIWQLRDELYQQRQPPGIVEGRHEVEARVRGIVADSLKADKAWSEGVDAWVAQQERGGPA